MICLNLEHKLVLFIGEFLLLKHSEFEIFDANISKGRLKFLIAKTILNDLEEPVTLSSADWFPAVQELFEKKKINFCRQHKVASHLMEMTPYYLNSTEEQIKNLVSKFERNYCWVEIYKLIEITTAFLYKLTISEEKEIARKLNTNRISILAKIKETKDQEKLQRHKLQWLL